ncbi:hypothetical protein A0J61_04242 [Choanephora cucurbitarum]|uniref:Uncharacterized protein n=1 Tax=Choanephora cucurbitarum TaxID=101091 RepID=A0A1C7NF21_9FUNG|nr:hypothetical protein A0J61_04242 [Choanephora cucurbitarum]
MLLNTFQKISLYKDMPPLALYAQAQTEHYKNSTIKREFFHQYKKKERAASLIREESNALQEGKIAGAILAGNGARSFGKKQNDVFDDDFVVEQEFVDRFYLNQPENDEDIPDSAGQEEDEEEDVQDNTEQKEDEEEDVKSEFLNSFRSKFKLMQDEKKWTLSDGTVVEDKLYDFGMGCSYEHLCHSYVIDPDDLTYRKYNIFSPQQLEEIRMLKPTEIPDISDTLEEYLCQFMNVEDINDLRQLLKTKQFYENYDHEKHADFDWICRTLDNLLLLYQNNLLTKTHNERWYQNRIWIMIDTLLETIEDINVIRGEACSTSNSKRKNLGRLPASINKMENKKMGHRQDMIITKNTFIEMGVGEEKHVDNNTNMMNERGLKCPKAMKDILLQMYDMVDYDSKLINCLSVVGLTTFGLDLYIDILDNPVNYTCRISRSNKMVIPQTIQEIPEKLLPLMSALLSLKLIIKKNSTLLNQCQRQKQNLKSSLKRAFSTEKKESSYISMINCAETPEEKGRFKVLEKRRRKTNDGV